MAVILPRHVDELARVHVQNMGSMPIDSDKAVRDKEALDRAATAANIPDETLQARLTELAVHKTAHGRY